ncbi:MAG: hypothetical protein J6U65_05615, partial [Bacteroidaceae bacterium]|nr:hypothetical protein [Bacteroidaceae bacterium]
ETYGGVLTQSTGSDTTMVMSQKTVTEELSKKQDVINNYKEEPRGSTTIQNPNGTAKVEVSNVRAALWANDNKIAIAADANGTRMVYQKTTEDGFIEHRDEISIGRHDDSSATHITLSSRSTTEEAGEQIKNTSTIQVNPEGISMSSPNGYIEDVVKEITDKAPKVGYAPDLKVNFAKELVGRGEASKEVIGAIRPTGVRSIGDGNATIERIKGESVVWNQLVDGAISFTRMSTQDNITYTPTISTENGNIYHILGVAKGSHKYLCTGSIVNSRGTTPIAGIGPLGTVFSLKDGGNIFLYPFPNNITVSPEDWARVEEPIQFHDLTLMFGAGNEPTTIEEFEARKPLGVSNEYNEGTIVTYNGEAHKSVGFNAWDEEWENGAYSNSHGGKTDSATSIRNTTPIKVCGGVEYYIKTNATTKRVYYYNAKGEFLSYETIGSSNTFTPPLDCTFINFYTSDTTYNHDICIHLAHTYNPEKYPNGYAPYEADTHVLPNISAIKDADGNQLFPNGLLSAGSVHDEITATKVSKRVGVVDMGTLNWGRYAESGGYIFQVTHTDIGVNSNTTSVPNLLNKAYPSVLRADIKTRDKCISQNNGAKALIIRDDAYTDATSFKQAMSGVLLYYELAEPIEVDLPEPLNMTYEAWDFGTEELLADGATTPLNADIVYEFNAVDRIRENSSAIKDKADKTYVDTAIATAITTTLNTEV